MSRRHPFALACLLLLAVALLPGSASAADAPRDVLYVGNNWDGTADVVDPHTFQRIARLNIVPDKEERLAEIQMDPASLGYFNAIRQLVGEGHDQFVDDMFSSHDGRFLYVSRPSLKDVIGLDLATKKIVWRTQVDGYRADHMAISPDGTRLLVSASTANVIDVIDTATGKIVHKIPSGDQPHESNFSADGKLIYHASIGTVYTPTDDPSMDASKGKRVFLILDAKTYKELARFDMGEELEKAGYPDMSSAVRPMALSPDEHFVYFQVSFFHGFVEFDLQAKKVTRIAKLPLSEEAAKLRREEYLLDSAHHGLSMNPDGSELCVAGTMSDYAAIVRRSDFRVTIAAYGKKPYWSTNSGDGSYCFVSFSGDDRVGVISYAQDREIASFQVGDHPQRMRMGKLRADLAPGVAAPAAVTKPRLVVRVARKRVGMRKRVKLRVRVLARRNGRLVPVAGATVRLAGAKARTNRRGWATLRKRSGFPRAGTYRVRASRNGYRSASARVRAR